MSIHFLTDLGVQVSVDVAGADQVVDTLRRYGRMGWTSGEVPPGGYLLPLENFATFDWSLIGARKYQDRENGEDRVYHRTGSYKVRHLAAVDTKKLTLPEAVKISRGARPTDPEHLKEIGDGDIPYMTLAIFRGGRYNPAYAVPGGGNRSGPRPEGKVLNEIAALAREQRLALPTLSELTPEEADALLAQLKGGNQAA